MKFGPEIATEKVRPAWLLDTDTIQFCVGGDWADKPAGYPADNRWSYYIISAIRLPDDHPYYLATSKGFTYWPGGESAPDDWDGGYVLLRNGYSEGYGLIWYHYQSEADIIGYRRKAAPNAETIAAIDEIQAGDLASFDAIADLMDDLNDQVKIAKVTRAEAYEDGLDIPTLEKLGLLKEETLLEKFEREHGGLDNNQRDIVEAFINWQEDE